MKSKRPEDLSADSLVRLAKENHEKVMANAAKREQAHKEKVASLNEEEKRLKAEIETAKGRLETMIREFDELDEKREEAKKIGSQALERLKTDLKPGNITMNQYLARQESEELKTKESMDKIQKKLGKAADLIRERGTEIVRLELALYETQSSIFSLLSFPVKSLRQSYKDLGDMLDFQFEGMMKDGHSAQTLARQKKNEISLIEKGVSVTSSGYIWSNISLKEAYHLRLDPVMPRDHIPSLLEQLDEIEPGEEVRLTVTFRQPGSAYPGLPLEVREEI